MFRSADGPKLRELFVAATVTAVVPNGHVIVAPGEVPHPPVHVNAVRPHWSGSEKPSWAGVRVAPNVVFPSNVSDVLDPFHVASVARIDAKASARPMPNT